MATSKKPTKKPAKVKTPKGRSTAMSQERRYDDPTGNADEANEHEEGEHEEQENPTPAAAPSLPPPHVSPQGSGAANSAAPKQPRAHLDQEQQFIAILAAIIYTKAGPHTIQQAYQQAKNLVQTLLDDEAEDEPEPEPEPED